MPSAEDLKATPSGFQDELLGLETGLRAAGIEFSAPPGKFSSPAAREYLLATSPQQFTAIAKIFGEWIAAPSSRKVRVQIGELEIETSTPQSIEEHFRAMEAFYSILRNDAAP